MRSDSKFLARGGDGNSRLPGGGGFAGRAPQAEARIIARRGLFGVKAFEGGQRTDASPPELAGKCRVELIDPDSRLFDDASRVLSLFLSQYDRRLSRR